MLESSDNSTGRRAMRTRWRRVPDLRATLDELAGLRLNHDPREPGGPGWHHDHERWPLATEAPGEPEAGGAWEIACRLVRDYEFVPPSIIRGYFHRDAPLEGRDMLLVGRFLGLRFPMGVRVDTVVDTTRTSPAGGRERAWGWSYRTLEHHLERGRLLYEVTKDLADGRVELVLTGVSQRADIPDPIVRLGFGVFGRWTQRRFYRAVGRRLTTLLADLTASGAEPPTPQPIGDGDVVTAPGRTRSSARTASPTSPDG